MTNRFSRVQVESDKPQFTVAHSQGKVPCTYKECQTFEVNILNVPDKDDYEKVRYMEKVQNGIANLLNEIFYGVVKKEPPIGYNADLFWTKDRLWRLLVDARDKHAAYGTPLSEIIDEFLAEHKREVPKECYTWAEMKKLGGERCLTPDEQQLYDVLWKRLEGELKKNMEKLRDQALLPFPKK